MRLSKNGVPKTVHVDDILPTIDKKTAFCCERKGALWVPLLNKAWAKLHGGYLQSRINSLSEAMRDLTGAPSDQRNFETQPNTFNFIKEGLKKNYLMVATIDLNDTEAR